MDIQNGAMFLINCFLAMGGLVIIAAGLVAINNLVAKYWRPVKFVRYEYVEKVIEE
jgi:hypothetical protein